MTEPLKKLMAALSAMPLDLTAEQIADSLWLAWFTRKRVSILEQGLSTGPDDLAPKPRRVMRFLNPLSSETSTGDADLSRQSSTAADAYTQPTIEGGESKYGDLRFKSGSALPHRLDLARALRPLTQKTPSRTHMVFDEELTVNQIANSDLWSPIMSPEQERRFDVTLIIDNVPSLSLWAVTIRDFQGMLERHGAFHRVTRWTMRYSIDGQVEVRRDTRFSGGAWRPLTLFQDYQGRQQLLLLITHLTHH